MKYKSLDELNETIIACRKCPRLVAWREQVAREKIKRHADEDYWGKPVPSFGDPNARLMIVGLAPAAHGANRTGRNFTGDLGPSWLMMALHETGFSNIPTADSVDDGLALTDCYICSSCHCAPPQNKPTTKELNTCNAYLQAHIELMPQVKAYLCLGSIGFRSFMRAKGVKGLKFGHGVEHKLPSGQTLLCSYHPSRYNTQTGRLKWEPWLSVFRRARELVES